MRFDVGDDVEDDGFGDDEVDAAADEEGISLR